MAQSWQFRRRFLIAAGIGLPWLLVIFLNPHPAPLRLSHSFQQARLAEAHLSLQKAASATAVILEFQPWRTDLWIKLGQFYLQTGKWRDAIQSLENAASRPGFTTEGLVLLGKAYWLGGSPKLAINTWQPLATSGKAPLQTYADLVALQRQEGDLAGAAQTLQSWIERQPGNAHPLLELGLILVVHEPALAVEALDEAAAIDRSLSGQVFQLRKALRKEDCRSEVDCTMQTGRALAGLGQWDLAALLFEQAAAQSPAYAEAWAFLGEAQQQTGKDGFAALQRAESLSPNSPTVRALMSLYWRRQGKPEMAQVFLRALAALEPEQATWQIELGNTAAEAGDLKAAMNYFQKAASLEPENPLVWANLARFCVDHATSLREEGLPAARRLLMLSPQDPTAHVLMGRVLFDLQDFASAERFLLQAIQLDDNNAYAHLMLGQFYLQNENYDPASYHLQRALSLSKPDQPERMLARRLLERFFPGRY